MAGRRYAVDCDLRRVHCVGDGLPAAVCTNSPGIDPVLAVTVPGDLVLFEIASAIDYTNQKSIAHHKRRWTIWNAAAAAVLDARLRARGVQFLVSPSHVWTKGYTLEVRTKLTGAVDKNKDLREARSMLWFHAREPDKWVPLADYLAAL
jgi:hypothetical protein